MDGLTAAAVVDVADPSRGTGDPELNAEMEVHSLTGVGAEKATHH